MSGGNSGNQPDGGGGPVKRSGQGVVVRAGAGAAVGTVQTRGARAVKALKLARKNWVLYAFLIPCLAYVIIFNYVPMYGVQIAFRDFAASKGIWGSDWVGLKHITRFLSSYHFMTLLKNTLTLSVYSLVAGFPMPIILAFVLNYTTFRRFRKFAQTATYAPHLISTVVIVGMLLTFMQGGGVFNQLLAKIGVDPVLWTGTPKLFPHIYVWSGIWQGTGWSSIIYIAVLAGVSSELHEAAIVDGANILHRIWYIDFAELLPTVVILLIMNLGQVMSVGFEKVFLLQNPVNLETSEVIATYVYKTGIQGAQYSFSAAVGLFNNLVNIVLLVIVNKVADVVTGSSLW
ncbi:MAG: ABC transporter permease subunit [Clostridiales bacterium]|jgi:putative aldouronate transport system permease protein|nr:ABC transporter permease subunit [Clostridiales bacterium]